MNRYLHNLTMTDYAGLAAAEHYRIERGRVFRFGLNAFGVPELAENILGASAELTRRLKVKKRAENAAKHNAAEKTAADWRAIFAKRR